MSAYSPGIFWAHKIVTASILLVGASLNVAAVFLGMQAVAATVFTTPGEIVLTAWFFAAFVLGILVEFRAPLAVRWQRVLRRVITVYMAMLTLAHGVNNLLLQNAATYAKIFSGPLYTYTAIVVLTGLAIVIATIPAPRHGLAAARADGPVSILGGGGAP